jgi:hypothetical protein
MIEQPKVLVYASARYSYGDSFGGNDNEYVLIETSRGAKYVLLVEVAYDSH